MYTNVVKVTLCLSSHLSTVSNVPRERSMALVINSTL